MSLDTRRTRELLAADQARRDAVADSIATLTRPSRDTQATRASVERGRP